MALFRLPKFARFASTLDALREGPSRKTARRGSQLKTRRLAIDRLEERQLLSVSPVDPYDVLVNQVVNTSEQTTLSGQSVAGDGDGDFVVTWTRYDLVFAADGVTPVIDSTTGQQLADANIYARYFTDEVQRITLPAELVEDNVDNQYGSFTLTYGGNEVQKLTFSATYQPYMFGQSLISGSFKIGFDRDGNGSISASEKTQTILYNEFSSFETTAATIQAQLQGLGGALADVEVQAINANEFLVNFGDASQGLDQPELVIEPVDVTFTSGFFPAITVDTIREPITIGPIFVSPDDALLTAVSIESNFLATATNTYIGPTDFPPPDRMPLNLAANDIGPSPTPDTLRSGVPGVSATPISTTEFDITFDGGFSSWLAYYRTGGAAPQTPNPVTNQEGEAGKKDHPLLVVQSAADELGNVVSTANFDVVTLKETSPEFRVNPVEPDNPFTNGPDRFDQTEAAVAMDADGDFVITWQSEVPNSGATAGSVSDIFARRFTAQGLIDPADVDFIVDADNNGIVETPIQGVQALVSPQTLYTQRLTFDATGAGQLTGTFQFEIDGFTSIEIDFDSTDLTTVASRIRQQMLNAGYRDVTVSVVAGTDPYKFDVKFRKTFDSAVGPDEARVRTKITILPGALPAIVFQEDRSPTDLLTFRVNTNTTNIQGQPTVGMDDAGNFVIAWGGGGQDVSFFNDIRAQRYDRDGVPLGQEFAVNTPDTSVHFDPYVALSHDGNVLMLWTSSDTPPVHGGGGGIVGTVDAKVYASDGLVLLDQFNVGGVGSPTGSFDRGENFYISWFQNSAGQNVSGSSSDVFAVGYELFDAEGNVSGAIIRDEFRVNSGAIATSTGEGALWSGSQLFAQIMADADGDLVVTFEGVGPDTATGDRGFISLDFTYFEDELDDPANADLAPYFSGFFDSFDQFSGESVDLDVALNGILIDAYKAGATNEQIGRLRKLIDDVVGVLRGDAWAVMTTRFDAATAFGDPLQVLFSDNVSNAERSGHNQTYILTISEIADSGSFTLRMSSPYAPGTEDITITPVFTQGGGINVGQTRNAIETALENATRTGLNWDWGTGQFPNDVVIVNVLQSPGVQGGEIARRAGTPWEIIGLDPTFNEVVFEITIQGENHDAFLSIGPAPGDWNDLDDVDGNPAPDPLILNYILADSGVMQTEVSGAIEPKGDYVMAWTQLEQGTGGFALNQNIYYRRFVESTDNAGPQVTDVVVHDTASHVDEGDTVQSPVTHLVMTFDENMLNLGLDAVTNPDNYVLLKDGVEVPGGIAAIQYGMNKASSLSGTIDPLTGTAYDVSARPSNKWEVVFTLDGNGLDAGVPALDSGLYTIQAIAAVDGTPSNPLATGLRDVAGNPLGFNGFVLGGADFSRTFAVVPGSPGNEDPPVTPPAGLENSRTFPESAQAVAVDADGDYVLAWTAYDTAAGLDRIYVRTYNANGASPIAAAFEVTPEAEFAADSQRFGAVAVDKDGDFIVTWTNYRGGDQDIYARRYMADGAPLGAPFLVNTAYTTGVQRISSVAMDTDGDFVIAWSSAGQEGIGLGYGVYARMYDSFGVASSPALRVNETTSGNQIDPAVAISSDGGFAITWTSTQGGTNDVYARAFNANGTALSPETLINTTAPGNQNYPDVAVDLSGENFVVTWTSSGSQDGAGLGVYASAFNIVASTITSYTGEFQVNTSTVGDQAYSSVAMNHAGNFVVTWSGLGNQLNQEDQDVSGVFFQRYTLDPGVSATPNGGETRMNLTIEGSQRYASVDSDGEGDFVAIWTGVGATLGTTNVFTFRSTSLLPVTDAIGPIVTDVVLTDADRTRVLDGDTVTVPTGGLKEIVVIFGENLSVLGGATGVNSVLNPNNWILERNGLPLGGAITSISFGLNASTRKYEATVQFDGDPSTAGVQDALSEGTYTLTARDPISDGANFLDGNFDAIPGGDYQITFILVDPSGPGDDESVTDGAAVSNARTQPETANAVAMDADGDHVVVITAEDPSVDLPSSVQNPNVDLPTSYQDRVWMRLYEADGSPASSLVRVANDSFFPNGVAAQRHASVAIDPDGDYVVTWTQYDWVVDPATEQRVLDPATGEYAVEANVYMRRFNAAGEPVPSGAAQIRLQATAPIMVNTWGTPEFFTYSVLDEGAIPTDQKWSDVAVDVNGDFIITWTSYSQEDNRQFGSGYGIYARRFDSFGQPLAPEFQINYTTEGNQMLSSVAIDNQGGFVVAWVSDQGGVGTDIIARSYWPDGSPQETALSVGDYYGEILVNVQKTYGNQTFPDVAMAADGSSYVVTWTGPDVNGTGVFGREIVRPTLHNTPTRIAVSDDLLGLVGEPIFGGGVLVPAARRTITVPNSFNILDLDVLLNIQHPAVSELRIMLKHGDTEIWLSDQNPKDPGTGQPIPYGAGVNLANFTDTIFDDGAISDVTMYPTVQPPYDSRIQPENLLGAFNGQDANGEWVLTIYDVVGGPYINPGADPPVPILALLKSWTLDFAADVVATPEFQVNTSKTGNQAHSSVAIADTGEFVITWSGPGNESGEADAQSGVFFQRYDAVANSFGAETRLNQQVDGRQWISSVDTDAQGNFAVVWTGEAGIRLDGSIIWDVFARRSDAFFTLEDSLGPIVTDVLTSQSDRVFDGGVLDLDDLAPINSVTVVFSETLSTRPSAGSPGPDSVRNPDNWTLVRNGVAMPGAIVSVDFPNTENTETRKYEATLHFDGDSLANGLQPLAPGEYVLIAHDTIQDDYEFLPTSDFFGGNSLDGDFDTVPGTEIDGLRLQTQSYPGYQVGFTVTRGASVGAEHRVNNETLPEQVLAAWGGTGLAKEANNRTVAVDDDGDFVVVWTSYGDDPAHPTDSTVYLRMFDRNNNPLTGDIQVNTDEIGHQRNASVAIDADGDVIVVWEGETLPPDGFLDWDSYGLMQSDWNVYAQRFDSVGSRVGGQITVNTNTHGEQLNPAVACDPYGDFVVTWVTKEATATFVDGVQAQLFDSTGRKVGSEFPVNSTGILGTDTLPGRTEINPAVAMDRQGNFVVAWEWITEQRNGIAFNTDVAFQRFDSLGNALPDQSGRLGGGSGGSLTTRVGRNPQVAMDAAGNFIIAWEAFADDDDAAEPGPDSYGIYCQRFDVNANGLTELQANQVFPSTPANPYFAFDQVNPSVAMDANGDYQVVWNGNGAVPHPLDPEVLPSSVTNADRDGIWIRSFDPDATPESVSVQTRVNMTVAGEQKLPTIAMEPDGDSVVVWNGVGVGDQIGIFFRRYDQPTDTVGPILSGMATPSGQSIPQGAQVTETLTTIVVIFDEDMATSGVGSVKSLSNYRLLRDGRLLNNVITSVDFHLNPATNKYEAVLSLDGNGASAGTPALPDGEYELVVGNDVSLVRDKVGNPLGATALNPDGAPQSWTFNLLDVGGGAAGGAAGETHVNTDRGNEYTYLEATQPVASDAEGDTVIVWANTTAGQAGIWARLTTVVWTNTGTSRVSTTTDLPEIRVTTNATATVPSVAMDGDGDFVVTWSQYSTTTDWDVYARRYDALGNPLGAAFLVNTETADVQRNSTVAMDIDGDFIIAWQSVGQDGDGYGIYAQRFDVSGERLGGVHETQVLNFINNPIGTFQLRFQGVNTATISYDGNPFAIAATVETALQAIGADVEVTGTSLTSLAIRFVGEEGLTDQPQITVVNASITGSPGATISAVTQADGYSGEFPVNDTVTGDQVFASVAMDDLGSTVITWTSFGQDGDAADQSNIYAKQFVSNDAFRDSDGEFGWESYDYNGLSQQNPNTEFAVSTDDPANHVVPVGTVYDGVVQVVIPGLGSGSGSLLSTGRHILTAAHVVDAGGGAVFPSMDIVFDLPNGQTVITATQIFIHPDWNGDIFAGNDLAIIVLPEEAPVEAPRYDIYRGSGELGHEVKLLGYGVFGQGAEQGSDGLKRIETNVFEVYGEALNSVNTADFHGFLSGNFDVPAGKVLVYDFDSGLAANDALGQAIGRHDLGLGLREGSSSHGDSGGPSFLNGAIVGIVSGGVEYINADSDAIPLNVSYGTVGLHTRVSAFADWIDLIAQSSGAEFLVNTNAVDAIGTILVDNQSGDQRWSTVAVDADGDFVITWTSEGQDVPGDAVASGNGAYAKRFASDGTSVGDAFQVNTTTVGDQQYSRVDMDADGDFVIVWESFQDPQGSTPTSFGIFGQRYNRNELLTQAPGGPFGSNGEIGGEFQVNTTIANDQRNPGVAVDDTGDFTIVWSGYGDQVGQFDAQGIFRQRFQLTGDVAGPTVTDVDYVGNSGDISRLLDNATLDESVSRIIVTFGEDLNDIGTNGAASVTNPNNWQLTKDGQVLIGGIVEVQFGLNRAFNSGLAAAPSGKYEAVILFDDEPSSAGNQELRHGDFMLTAMDAVRDLFDNRLDGDYDGTPGDPFAISFTITTSDAPLPPPGTPGPDDEDNAAPSSTTGVTTQPAVARAPDGQYVVTWTRFVGFVDEDGNSVVDPFTGQPLGDFDIYARLFDRYGTPLGAEFLVNSYTTGSQIEPTVATDAFGNFVIAWSGEGEDDISGVYARVFDVFGRATGDQFRVNQFRGTSASFDSVQDMPTVAMDAAGHFVVSWTSFGQDGDLDGVYARRFNFNGQPAADEFRVNVTTANRQEVTDIAMEDNGDFVVVWNSFGQDGSSFGVYGRRYNAVGTALGGEFRINQTTADKQLDAKVAMDADGDFVVAWSSYFQDGSGYGVYARRYNTAGVAQGGEFRVNTTTLRWQHEPDVAMTDNGDFVVTWTTWGSDYDLAMSNAVNAKMYNADGSDFLLDGAVLGEFRVNADVEGDQQSSAVSMDADGHYTVVWVGQTTTEVVIVGEDDEVVIVEVVVSNVYHRVIDPPGADATNPAPTTATINGTSGKDTLELIGGAGGSWTVKLNGVTQNIDAGVSTIEFDGFGKYDAVRVKGSSGSDVVHLWPDHITVPGLTVNVANVEEITADTGGGTDTVVMHGGDVADMTGVTWGQLTASKTSATFSGPGFFLWATGYENLEAYAGAGVQNIASLYDSAGDDQFYSDVDKVAMSGDGYELRAHGFAYAHGYATSGGFDTADFYDSAGDDTVYSYKGFVMMYDSYKTKTDPGYYYRRAKQFENTTVHSVNGIMSGSKVGDIAYLHDSHGDDVFTAAPDQASMETNVGVDGNGQPTYGQKTTAMGFNFVHAYGVNQGTDVAHFYDSSFDDVLLSVPVYTALYSEDAASPTGYKYFVREKFFEYVYAHALAGGNDYAYLHDSTGDDTFVAEREAGTMITNAHTVRAEYFEQLGAYTRNGGNDTAEIYDAALIEEGRLLASPDTDCLAWLNYFENVIRKRDADQGGDTALDAAIDKVFTAYWS